MFKRKITDVAIIAPTEREGAKWAQANGHDSRNVIIPGRTYRFRGRTFSDFEIVGRPKFSVGEWADMTPMFLSGGSEVIDRLYYAALQILPPPIELERVKVVKF